MAWRLCAGFLAGASGVLALLAGVALLLLVGGIWPTLYDIASGLRGKLPFWPTLAHGLAQSFGNLPAFFWSARWVVAALGLAGLALALAEDLAARVMRPWRHLIGQIALLGLVGTIALALQYTNRENLLAWVAAEPALASLQASVLVSDAGALIAGVAIALPSVYVVWAVWSWWYVRWERWLGLPAAAVAPIGPSAPPPPAEDWRAYQERMHRLKRAAPVSAAPTAEPEPAARAVLWWDRRLQRMLGLIAGATLVLLASIWLFHLYGSQLSSGDLFVSRKSPTNQVVVNFSRPPRQLIVAGISGSGVAEISIGRANQTTPVQPGMALQLLGAGEAPSIATFDLASLEPGRYWLKIGLRDGDNGQVRYTALQGGGVWAQAAAWAIGLAGGSWLALAALITCEILAQRGWFSPKAA